MNVSVRDALLETDRRLSSSGSTVRLHEIGKAFGQHQALL